MQPYRPAISPYHGPRLELFGSALEFLINLADEAVGACDVGTSGSESTCGFCVPWSSQLRCDHFLLGLALRDQLLHLVADAFDHFRVRHQVRPLDPRAVAWDERRVRTGDLHKLVAALEHTVQRAAVSAVDERIPVVTVEVADHDHVSILEPNHRIAAGMCRSNGYQIDDFPVHVQLYRRAHSVSNNGISRRIPRGNRVAVGRPRWMDHLI